MFRRSFRLNDITPTTNNMIISCAATANLHYFTENIIGVTQTHIYLTSPSSLILLPTFNSISPSHPRTLLHPLPCKQELIHRADFPSTLPQYGPLPSFCNLIATRANRFEKLRWQSYDAVATTIFLLTLRTKKCLFNTLYVLCSHQVSSSYCH